ncbi:MAG: oxygen-insensitive NADPH nitroreductase [Snodgrassella sp.]|uniref:oxygen-insensitive NADPH nitroreductase n=1 Tax=Snodgrassella TaxID=1193515 RepID=UPI000815AD3F|nr:MULTISPECIES: oxygen-insensitive NADPH nitroreductase [Snodgrassella]MCO6506199.1 oxygen-insensitive NADPH nitroreductase [Snodgrassella sp.]MCO6517783.1 oxygen-insensitive NADPH nitroreductase [Snodgrassella sp.]MCO6522951.1 oxygen-insensitive NADPH nitroreductase [Snodgrassella sp.]SCB79329.1 nitroreductase [Snodgrassella sp. R-53583]
MSYHSNLSSAATLPTIYRHRSIRKFTDEALTDEQREAIWEAGRAASSSSFMQIVHIIRVTDMEKRAALSEVAANQKYVRTAAEFWVFCVDYTKHKLAFPEAQLDWTEGMIIGAVDAGIMAQNCLLAAESLGLGGVYIGSLRNDVQRAAELLELPQLTFPLFGLCLGYPAQDPMYRPRLPLDTLVSENRYRPLDPAKLAAYDEQLNVYYRERSGLELNWSKAVANNFAQPVRPQILPFLHQQGLAKR